MDAGTVTQRSDTCALTWTEPEPGPTPYWNALLQLLDYDLPSCLLTPQLSLSQELQEAAEVLRFFFCPFLKVWLKIKGVLKASPAQKAVCRCDANQHLGL